MKTSIIMSFKYRPTLIRTLESWTNLPEDVEFLFCDNASADPLTTKEIVFKSGLPISCYQRNDIPVCANRNWNALYKEAKGDFIIFTMADEIISTKNIIQEMLNTYQEGERVSVLTYELNAEMTWALDKIPWQENPRIIETLPGFWTDSWCVNTTRHGAGLLMHTTGMFREDWDYFGLFRNEDGYLLQDRDIVLREQVLKKSVHTPDPRKSVCSYHQFHDRWIPKEWIEGPSFTYFTEREARLLDPVPPDPRTV